VGESEDSEGLISNEVAAVAAVKVTVMRALYGR
jgi:hypothetical protein